MVPHSEMGCEHGQWAVAYSPEVQGSALGVTPEHRAAAEADGRSREGRGEPRVPLLLWACRAMGIPARSWQSCDHGLVSLPRVPFSLSPQKLSLCVEKWVIPVMMSHKSLSFCRGWGQGAQVGKHSCGSSLEPWTQSCMCHSTSWDSSALSPEVLLPSLLASSVLLDATKEDGFPVLNMCLVQVTLKQDALRY